MRLAAIALVLCFASSARAQTWSLDRQRPSLFEIIAVDASGDSGWPYGVEDLAGDGIDTHNADEAAVDVRSVYADARAGKLWLRAYAASKVKPTASTLAFFFIDSDANASTGGPARFYENIALDFGMDPTPGGYERAIGVRGDGTLLGVFFWDVATAQWMEHTERPPLAAAEAGVTRDPLRLFGDDHAYWQVALLLEPTGLDASCGVNIFVRTADVTQGTRVLGDDVVAAPCHASLNRYGDPELLHTERCGEDAVCPAQGKCREATCVFGYECSSDAACPSGDHCVSNVCVRALDKKCSANTDCDGLVCGTAGKCVACSNTGAQACSSERVCSPNGSCLLPSGGGANDDAEPKVRGGAFTCSSSPAAIGGSWIMLALLAWVALRTRRNGES
jgi:hypothetical protein